MRKLLPVFLLLILAITYPNKIFANAYFDTYLGNISWNEEKAHLYALARELKYDSDLIGYIAFRTGAKDNRKIIDSRIARIRKHLFSKYGFSENRIVFVISNTPSAVKETFIILQPLSKDNVRPAF